MPRAALFLPLQGALGSGGSRWPRAAPTAPSCWPSWRRCETPAAGRKPRRGSPRRPRDRRGAGPLRPSVSRRCVRRLEAINKQLGSYDPDANWCSSSSRFIFQQGLRLHQAGDHRRHRRVRPYQRRRARRLGEAGAGRPHHLRVDEEPRRRPKGSRPGSRGGDVTARRAARSGDAGRRAPWCGIRGVAVELAVATSGRIARRLRCLSLGRDRRAGREAGCGGPGCAKARQPAPSGGLDLRRLLEAAVHRMLLLLDRDWVVLAEPNAWGAVAAAWLLVAPGLAILWLA